MNTVKSLLLVGVVLLAADSFAQTWTNSGAPNLDWECIASSADGSRLVAGAFGWGYCISTNSGATWVTNTEPQYGPPYAYGSWTAIASSADGTTLAAINYTAIWASTNSGATWFSNNVPGVSYLACLALSADGKKLAVADGRLSTPGLIYTSTNLGVTVVPTTSPAYNWTSIASSADGAKLVAAALNSQGFALIYTSTNSGATWVSNSVPGDSWQSVASSADGTKLVAVADSSSLCNGAIYTSANSGATWVSNKVAGFNWYRVASSADGDKLVAAEFGGCVYTSTNSGAAWASNNVPAADWYSVASSADGNKLAAITPEAGFIYTSYSTPAPALGIAPSAIGSLTLAWTVPSTNFVLQQSADFDSWTNVTNPPALNCSNLQNQVTLPPSGSSAFYRLKTP